MRTVSAIEAEMLTLEEKRDVIKQQLRALELERNEAINAAAVEKMSPSLRAAVIKAHGIPSAESFGTPGAK